MLDGTKLAGDETVRAWYAMMIIQTWNDNKLAYTIYTFI